jgi:hypothetical protein
MNADPKNTALKAKTWKKLMKGILQYSLHPKINKVNESLNPNFVT